MREWLPEGHLACFINDTVDDLAVRPIYHSNEPRIEARIEAHIFVILKAQPRRSGDAP